MVRREELSLGGETWEYREGGKSRELFGSCDLENHIIHIYGGLTEQQRVEIILHELLHAVFPTMREERVAGAAKDISLALSKIRVSTRKGWKRG